MKLVVGLGNPGPEYENTRHNIGFMVVDALARRLRAEGLGRKWQGVAARAFRGGQEIFILKPSTYMNLSGRAVLAAQNQLALPLQEILIVSDELALPVGTLRFRPRGSSGGQKGLQSIIDSLGSSEFPRLRLGIGPDSPLIPKDFVLENFSAQEVPEIEQTMTRAVQGIEHWLARGIEPTMARFNGAVPAPKGESDE
jgi:PTH1 family peptidyl-tRNA hydrolase